MYNSRFDNLINGFFEGFTTPTYSSYYKNMENGQPYEINYTKDGAYLIFEVPGFNKTNLKVEMEDGVLYVEGTRTYKRDGEDFSKSVKQTFKIGKEYDSDKIEATIEDGILTVFIQNLKKQEKKKRISLL